LQELHSNFLEINLISQIRAVTTAHPITIYLSPTSTAVINVTQIEPPLKDPTRRPFAILSPQAEVIVAPKVRHPPSGENESPFDLTNTKKSVASTSKSKLSRRKTPEPSILLRTICLPHPTFQGDPADTLCVYIDPFLNASKVFAGGLAKISILASPSKPSAPAADKDKENHPTDTELALAKHIVVKVEVWDDVPDDHIGISPRLATTLGINGLGDIAKFVPSGSPVKKAPSKLVFHPFSTSQSEKSTALRVGGDKSHKDEANAKDKEISTFLQESLKYIFNSPITEGMCIHQETASGTLSFSGHAGDWFQPRKPEDYTISLGRDLQDPFPPQSSPKSNPHKIVSIEKLLNKAEKTLVRNGSILITGGRGAGNSATLLNLSQRMQTHLFCNLLIISLNKKILYMHPVDKLQILLYQLLKIPCRNGLWKLRFMNLV
jgi:peroxin-1